MVKLAGVGRLRSVNEPMSSVVSDTVLAVLCPDVAVIVTPPSGPATEFTWPEINPSP